MKAMVEITKNEYNAIFEMSQREQSKMIAKYEPLVNKITNQFVQKVKMPWSGIKSMAYEGLVLAFKNYDPSRSSLTFLQFAGFSIRNTILSSIDNEARTVKMNQYTQKQAIENGDPIFNTVRIDFSFDNDDANSNTEIRLGAYENEKFSCGDIYEYLYYRLEDRFNKRDCEMFYKTFGLKGFNDEKCQDIAKEYGVSNGLISQKIKKIVNFIKGDEDLCEMLAQMLEK